MGRIIYNSLALYVGPSGKNFLSYTGGNLVNGYEEEFVEYHLECLSGSGSGESGSGSGESGSGSGESGSGSGESGSGSGESGSGSGESGDCKGDVVTKTTLRTEEFDWSGSVHNLVSQLDRIQNFNYNINLPQENLTQINTTKIIDRPIINSPEVSFSFDYLIADVSNEAKMGFYVNFPQYGDGKNGEPFFESIEKENNNGLSQNGGNFSYSILSGFFSEDIGEKEFYESGELDPFYPTEPYRDRKNYYLAVRNDRQDIYTGAKTEDFLTPDDQTYINEEAKDYNVVSFGNCYMNSYSTKAAVGSLPLASVNFVGENIRFETSGVDFTSPSIEPKKGSPLLDEFGRKLRVDLPRRIRENKIAVLNPGDIVFTPHFVYEECDSESGDAERIDSFTGMGVAFENIHLNSYSIDMSIPRETQKNLGYKFPLDRRLISTAPVSLSIEGIVSGMGNSQDILEDLWKINQDYDFTIALKGPRCHEDIFLESTMHTTAREKYKTINAKKPLINYFFKSAKLNSFSYSSSIGENLIFSASFSTEIDPDDLSKGFFISGFLSNVKYEEFLLRDDGFYIELEQSKDIISTNNVPLF